MRKSSFNEESKPTWLLENWICSPCGWPHDYLALESTGVLRECHLMTQKAATQLRFWRAGTGRECQIESIFGNFRAIHCSAPPPAVKHELFIWQRRIFLRDVRKSSNWFMMTLLLLRAVTDPSFSNLEPPLIVKIKLKPSPSLRIL